MRRPILSESLLSKASQNAICAVSDMYMNRLLCCHMQSRDRPQVSRRFRPLTSRSGLEALHQVGSASQPLSSPRKMPEVRRAPRIPWMLLAEVLQAHRRHIAQRQTLSPHG